MLSTHTRRSSWIGDGRHILLQNTSEVSFIQTVNRSFLRSINFNSANSLAVYDVILESSETMIASSCILLGACILYQIKTDKCLMKMTIS